MYSNVSIYDTGSPITFHRVPKPTAGVTSIFGLTKLDLFFFLADYLVLYIAIGVVCGIILLALLVAAIIMCCKKSKQSYHVDYGKYVYYNAAAVEMEDVATEENKNRHPNSNGAFTVLADEPNGSNVQHSTFKPGEKPKS